MLEQWFVQKYHLPPTHSLFLEQPLSVHLRSFFEDQLDERETLEARLRDGNMDVQLRVRMLAQISAIDAVFADRKDETKTSQDPLAAYWERQIERGEEPNFDLTVKDLRDMGEL